jgi:hypothetical protein
LKYLALKRSDAKRYLMSLTTEAPLSLEDLIYDSGSGLGSISEKVDELVSNIEDLRSNYPALISKKGDHAKDFELKASMLVHQQLFDAELTTLADPDFWMWLAIARMDPIIRWRYGDSTSVAHFSNYGVNGLVENFAFRLWLRGEIGYVDDNPADPYELARIDSLDFWRSHLFRQSFSNARQVARAVVMLQAGKLAVRPLTTLEIRHLAKELKRMKANVVFEFLSMDQALALIIEQASRTIELSAAGGLSKE